MRLSRWAFGGALLTGAFCPAAAQPFPEFAGYDAKPKTVAVFSVADTMVEMQAVSRRARASTIYHRKHAEECADYSGVMPGYPQPAFVSVDLKVRF